MRERAHYFHFSAEIAKIAEWVADDDLMRTALRSQPPIIIREIQDYRDFDPLEAELQPKRVHSVLWFLSKFPTQRTGNYFNRTDFF